jgi:hypothetical protein
VPSQVFVVVAQLRDILEEHRRIIAAEPPSIVKHAEDCTNAQDCSRDWYTVWWSGMGRMLLDGRNPLSFEEALKRFEHLQFGEMAEGCKAEMLSIVKEGTPSRY